MSILLSNDELDLLYEQHEFYFKLYIMGIRRYMDYQTGIVGIKRRISYQSLREIMYVHTRRGVKKEKCEPPTKSKLQRAIKHLIKVGLLEQISNEHHLIFRCILAKKDQSVQNKPDTKPIHQADIKQDIANFQNSLGIARSTEDLNNKADTLGDMHKNTKPDTPPISGKDKEKELLRSSKKKVMPDDFNVTDHHIQLAMQNGWPDPATEIESFKDYHLARATKFADWDRAFYTWLRNTKKFAGGKHGNHQSRSKPNSFDRAIENIINSPTRSR